MAPRISLGKFRQAVPEVWFRIIHLSADHFNGSAELREQTVEIALGPEGAFENGNIGVLTRRVPASQVICAVPERELRPKQPPPPKQPRPSSAARFLRLAQEWQRQLDSGEVESQAAIARREGLTRARVCQVMSLLHLGPEVQQHILAPVGRHAAYRLSERSLRRLATMNDPTPQRQAFLDLICALA